MRYRTIALLVALSTAACFEDKPDRRLEKLVEILVKGDESTARQASTEIATFGADAVAIIETGLYDASPEARLRIVRTLAAIGGSEPAAILRHLAQNDPDGAVREAAERALEPAAAKR